MSLLGTDKLFNRTFEMVYTSLTKGSFKSPDIFICHASEDKEEIARPLATKLDSQGLTVWYDEFSLTVGDSLRRTIERGLSKSKFAVVIVSQNFFTKEWPQRELDALIQREIRTKKRIILPVWHKVDQKTVEQFSPLLADTFAASTEKGLEDVVSKILNIVKQKSKKIDKLLQTQAFLSAAQDTKRKPDDIAFVDINFKKTFVERLDLLVTLLDTGKSWDHQVNDLIDVIIMLFKERIDKWDVPSVKFATNELFIKLYKFSEHDEEKGGLNELYFIFKDLFAHAYSQRKQLIGAMMESFSTILFKSWIPETDIEKGEKASRVLLRLGIDFLNKDLEITKDCATAIDNLVGDLFEPEILSKEIILAASVFEKGQSNPNTKDLIKELVRWIKINDQYSWDAEIKTYLRDSIGYAEFEKDDYGISLNVFKQKFLYPTLNENIDEEIEGFVDFLGGEELEDDADKNNLSSFDIMLLTEIILAYEFLRPNIANEIRQKITEKNDRELEKKFNTMINSSKLLKKIYNNRSDMITTFNEFIKFLEANLDSENNGIGSNTYNYTMIEFERRLKKGEKETLEELVKKYKLPDFEIEDQGISFEVDELLHYNGKRDEVILIQFLKEVNNIMKIVNFATGMEFKFRVSNESKKAITRR